MQTIEAEKAKKNNSLMMNTIIKIPLIDDEAGESKIVKEIPQCYHFQRITAQKLLKLLENKKQKDINHL